MANSRECVEGGGAAGSTHEESEDASEARFTLKYLGSTLVETPSSEEATAEAIKTVITMAKASGKKLQRVSLAVSLRGIRMTDLATEEDQLQVSIYRYDVISFVARLVRYITPLEHALFVQLDLADANKTYFPISV